MGESGLGFHLNFNSAKFTKRKPKNWIHKGYKITVPYDFKWRHKIGKVECDCKTCHEHYQPWYGIKWYHSEDCALIQHINRRPQICNLSQYYGTDMKLIACTE